MVRRVDPAAARRAHRGWPRSALLDVVAGVRRAADGRGGRPPSGLRSRRARLRRAGDDRQAGARTGRRRGRWGGRILAGHVRRGGSVAAPTRPGGGRRTEGPSWTLDLTPSGARLDPAPSGEPV